MVTVLQASLRSSELEIYECATAEASKHFDNNDQQRDGKGVAIACTKNSNHVSPLNKDQIHCDGHGDQHHDFHSLEFVKDHVRCLHTGDALEEHYGVGE